MSPNASAGTPVGGIIDTDTTWSLSGSPYWVWRDVRVRNGANLTIEIGVDVLFNGSYSIIIEEGATLWLGKGTTERPYALFTWNTDLGEAYPGRWGAIRFDDLSYDSSNIMFSVIEYATYGVRLESASPTIHNTTIRNCVYGIYSNNGSPIIDNNTVENCTEDGIYINGNDVGGNTSYVKNNIIANNTEHGLVLYDVSDAWLRNNTISNSNYTFGVWGDTQSEFDHDIDDSNTIDSDPIYYWRDHEHDDESIPSDAGYVGIVNSSNITVSDLILDKNGQGVLVAYSDLVSIDNVTAIDNELGAVLYSSPNNTILNSNISSNDYNGYYQGQSGIYLYYSDYNSVSNNIISDNEINGSFLYYSKFNNLGNNTMNSNDNGIYLVSSDNNTVSNNTLSSNSFTGIILSGPQFNDVNNNTVTTSAYGICVYFGASANYISYNFVSSCIYGIYMGYSSVISNLVNSNNASNNDYGICLEASSYNTIKDNIVNSNDIHGIYIYHHNQFTSQYNVIINNSAIDNGQYGINLQGDSMSLDWNHITGNTISLNGDGGIFLTQTLHNTITWNNISSNNDHGIYLQQSADRNNLSNNDINSHEKGIMIQSSGLNNITFNKIYDNDYGIYLLISEKTNITKNNISGNNYDGIYIVTDNLPDEIYDNIITWNNRTGINCTSSSNTTIKSNDIENNTWYGVWSGDESDPVINYNNICNNGEGYSGDGWGVYNDDDSLTIDAENNWWNAVNGPSGEGPGFGDRVSLYVDYDPYSPSRL